MEDTDTQTGIIRAMTYRGHRGHIKNGSVILDDPAQLPEGSQVLIMPVESQATPADLLRQVTGKGQNLPDDGSVQHDHYIYGTPKR